ncbi:hypothetical protein COY05_02800 [Candidatus Peregrinibacteria bacterium CG_4_10_14_0_2_um_filter_38_24]|nr:MAG: hypothetical protein COY05_02800 [Candidatus Peregrinibacteria bacterium CG_4_10_14_0_2_um_filter_38_24]PJC39184.1 MAG: hypothetical protein CO044_01110 [Candidatus Peregrinibacteria bacterium CG_4_9_14_0_2_um_filter_38_9]
MKIFRYGGANKFLKSFIYVASLSLLLSFSFSALAEEVAPVLPMGASDLPMDFLKEKILDEMAKKIPFEEIVPVNIEPQNFIHEVIEVDPNAVHSCRFGSMVGLELKVRMFLRIKIFPVMFT